MDLEVLADFGQFRWLMPHQIPAIKEDEEEDLFPLDERFMVLPPLRMQDLVLMNVRGQSQPPDDQGATPIQGPPPDTWPVYQEMDYFAFEDVNAEEWGALQMEAGQEEDLQDEIMNSNASQQETSLSAKHREPISNDKQLLRDIGSSAAYIATVGVQELPMPDVTPPVFASILEPHISSM